MIDVTNLSEIFAHMEAHPATAIYSTCPCGVEINSYTGWVEHAVMPLVTDAVMGGFTAGLTYREPQQDSPVGDTTAEELSTLTPFDLMGTNILDADLVDE